MDPTIWIAIGFFIANIIGWVISYGRMCKKQGHWTGEINEKLKNLSATVNDGLCEKVDDMNTRLTRLEEQVKARRVRK